MVQILPGKTFCGMAIGALLLVASPATACLDCYGEPPRVEQPPAGPPQPPGWTRGALALDIIDGVAQGVPAPRPDGPLYPPYYGNRPWERPDWTDFVRHDLNYIMVDDKGQFHPYDRSQGLRRRLNMKLGEPPGPKDAPTEDPESRRIEANDEIRDIETKLKDRKAERRRIRDLLDYVDMYPDQKAKVAYEDLDMIDADQVDGVLGDWLDGLDDEIDKLEKDLKKAKKKLAKALADLDEAEKKYKKHKQVKRLPRDGKGGVTIDGELGGDKPFDPSAKDPPGGKKADAQPADGAGEKPNKKAAPSASGSGKKKTAAKPSKPKEPVDEALEILRKMDADEAAARAAKKVVDGAKKAADAAKKNAPPAPKKKSRYLPRDKSGNPVINEPLGQPSRVPGN